MGMASSGEEPTKLLTVTAAHTLSQCNVHEQGLRWIRDEQEWADWRERLRMPESLFSPDLNRHGLLLIHWGAQPNPGYQLGLLDESVELSGERLVIDVIKHTPQPGMIYPQVMTSPCLLLELPLANYGVIEVRDQQGGKMGEVGLDGAIP